MIDLVLLGGPDGGAFAAALSGALSRSFRVAAGGAPPPATDFVLKEPGALTPGADGSILVCKNDGAHEVSPALRLPNTVAILRSDQLSAARALGRLHIPAVSCGMSMTDTLTFSSLTGESAVICLQRSIPLLGGGWVEPAEAPLALSRPYGGYVLMCAVAVVLLTGGWELLGGLEL